MKFVKNSFVMFFMIMLFATVLTACGSKTDNNPSNATTDSSFDANERGEDEFPGKIKSEEELAALEEEARQYEEQGTEANSEPEENPANVDMETPTAASTYISADNFWQGDDYFDLEEFLYMNGAMYVKKGEWETDASSFKEKDGVASVYKAQYAHPNWMVYVAPPTTIWFEYMGYRIDGEIVFFPQYLATQLKPVEEQRKITINEYGVQMSDTAIQTLDHMFYLMKTYPDSDDPFQYNELTDIFTAPKSSDEYPEGITQ